MLGRMMLCLALGWATASCAAVTVPGAQLRQLYADCAFSEGPTCDSEGRIVFSDQPNDRLLVCGLDGKVTVLRQGCGRANGLCYDREGYLWSCSDEKNELWRVAPDGKVEVLVREAGGKLLNGPNDVWCAPGGGAYFTDPYYKRSYWQRGGQEQPCQGVYYLAPDHQTLTRVADDLTAPNGLVGTPDGKTLYVADIGAGKTWHYAIGADGALTDKKLFCSQGSDGMTLDEQGNVYLTGRGVSVYDRDGKPVETIAVPQGWTANVCFGGADRKTLYITAGKCLYAITMAVTGASSQ